MFGDFAPAVVNFADDVLFGQVWKRQQLTEGTQPGDGGQPDNKREHRPTRLPPRPGRDNGATEQELIETIAHLAFYAGWPKATSAMAVAKQVLRST
ncbi:MAG: 4-carboxymuconolactone decarboxylase [Pseudonocardiales bacterium]|jgi:4-carboxymuconolactone decarboxylase|nr:4-carboxymuconolactone decarboxylase [Pseudonocardiales bacterium]